MAPAKGTARGTHSVEAPEKFNVTKRISFETSSTPTPKTPRVPGLGRNVPVADS